MVRDQKAAYWGKSIHHTTNGFFQCNCGNLEKSTSVEYNVQPYSMAKAAKWASVTGLPEAWPSVRSDENTFQQR